jgi:hypothetical protein
MNFLEIVYLVYLGLVFIAMLYAVVVGPWDIRRLGQYFKGVRNEKTTNNN